MGNPLSTKQFKEFLADNRSILRAYSDETAPKTLWRRLMNAAVYEMHELSGAAYAEKYKDSLSLTVFGTGGAIFTESGGADATYSYTESTKTLLLGLDNAGSAYINFANNGLPDASWIGAFVVLGKGAMGSLGNMVQDQVVAVAARGGSNHAISLTLKNGYGSDIAATLLSGAIIVGAAVSGGYISIASWVKSVDRITSIEDDANGLCLGGEGSGIDEKAFLGISKPNDTNSNFDDDIIWYWKGDNIRIRKGANITNYGNLTMNYLRKPVAVTADTDYIDIPDSHIRMLGDMVMIKIMAIQQKEIPPSSDLAATANKLENMKKSIAEENRFATPVEKKS